MSVRRMQAYLIGTIVVVLLALGLTVGLNKEPVLGLDLQGGISVVLEPVGDFRGESLDVAVDIIRNRVDGLGVAEPEISRQGDNIVVDLPGVKDRDKARRVVGKTAELRFRPVLAELPAEDAEVTTTTAAPATTVAGAPETSTTTTTLAPDDAAVKAAVAACDVNQLSTIAADGTSIPTTTRDDDKRKDCVVLPTREGREREPPLPRADEAHRAGRRRREVALLAGPGLRRRHEPQRQRGDQVQRDRRRVVSEVATAEPGRDRARRRGAVEPGVPGAVVRGRQRADQRETSRRTRRATSRRSSTTARCRCSSRS